VIILFNSGFFWQEFTDPMIIFCLRECSFELEQEMTWWFTGRSVISTECTESQVEAFLQGHRAGMSKHLYKAGESIVRGFGQ